MRFALRHARRVRRPTLLLAAALALAACDTTEPAPIGTRLSDLCDGLIVRLRTTLVVDDVGSFTALTAGSEYPVTLRIEPKRDGDICRVSGSLSYRAVLPGDPPTLPPARRSGAWYSSGSAGAFVSAMTPGAEPFIVLQFPMYGGNGSWTLVGDSTHASAGGRALLRSSH